MLDLVRFRALARRACKETQPKQLRNLVDEMMALLRAEQAELKEEIAERMQHYPGPPLQPGSAAVVPHHSS